MDGSAWHQGGRDSPDAMPTNQCECLAAGEHIVAQARAAWSAHALPGPATHTITLRMPAKAPLGRRSATMSSQVAWEEAPAAGISQPTTCV